MCDVDQEYKNAQIDFLRSTQYSSTTLSGVGKFQ